MKNPYLWIVKIATLTAKFIAQKAVNNKKMVKRKKEKVLKRKKSLYSNIKRGKKKEMIDKLKEVYQI